MPTIPGQSLPSVSPAGPTGVFETTSASPADFGGLSAQAGMGLGRSLEGAGDTAADIALKWQKQYNETAVDQASTSFDAQVRPEVGGFRELQGADAMSARADTLKKIEQIRQDTRGALNNPEQQRMFDYMSRRDAKRYLDEVEFHAAREVKVWQGNTAKGAIDNELNNSATYWNDDQRFAESLGKIKIQAARLSSLKGIDPESDAGKAEITHYTSEAWQARIKSVAAQDPDIAREMFDANADQIDAKHRAQLDATLTSQQYTRMQRDDIVTRREEARAAKEQQVTQAGNLAQLTANVLAGKPPSASQMADLVRNQQLAPHAVDFLFGLQKRRAAGPDDDNAQAMIGLHRELNDSSTSIDEKMASISAAAKAGKIKPATAGALVDQAYGRERRGETGLDTANFNELKTALSGHSVEQGLITDRSLAPAMNALWVSAQNEWNDRVRVKGERSSDVLADMLPRYAKAPQTPAAWPRPRMGDITSSQDVQAIAAKTVAAGQDGTLTPAQLQSESQLIQRYSNYFRQQDARVAAAKAKQPTSGGAKLKGVKPGEPD